jgi:hypothetical protein
MRSLLLFALSQSQSYPDDAPVYLSGGLQVSADGSLILYTQDRPHIKQPIIKDRR